MVTNKGMTAMLFFLGQDMQISVLVRTILLTQWALIKIPVISNDDEALQRKCVLKFRKYNEI